MDTAFSQPGPGRGCDRSLVTYTPYTATPGMIREKCDKTKLHILMVKKKKKEDMAVCYLNLSLLRD